MIDPVPTTTSTPSTVSGFPARPTDTIRPARIPMLATATGVLVLMSSGAFAVLLAEWKRPRLRLPFLAIFAGGYFYVGFASLHTLYKMHREAEIEAELAAAAEAAST